MTESRPILGHVLTCGVCGAAEKVLDALMREVKARTEGEGVDKHVLGAVCHWWVTETMAVTQGDVKEMFSVLAHVLAEHGVEIGLAVPVEDEEAVH